MSTHPEAVGAAMAPDARSLAAEPHDHSRLVLSTALITLLVAFGLPLAALISSLAGWREVETEPSAIDYVFLGGLLVGIGLVFGLLVPWALKKGAAGAQVKTGLVLGVAAWVTGVVFWTMAPVILGAASALVAYVGMRQGQTRWMAVTAIALGLSAALVTIVAYIQGF